MARNTQKIGEILARVGVKFAYRYPDVDLDVGPVLLRLSTRHDSTGFSLYWVGPRVAGLHWWKRWDAKRGRHARLPGFCFTFSPLVQLSNRWAHRVNSSGKDWTKLDHFACRVLRATFFAGYKARGGNRQRWHGWWPSIRLGLSSNLNAIPYCFA